MKPLILGGMVVLTWGAVILLFLGGRKIMLMIDGDNGPPVSANATLERRIHLTVDTRWDTDKRRNFECREMRP